MSYPDWYKAISSRFRDETSVQIINVLDTGLSWAIALAYAGALAMLALTADVRIWRVAAVPAATFAIVTVVRKRVNAARPYERYPIEPIIVKDKRGESMPSRHISSALAIACALAWIHPDWGVTALFASAVLAFTRIVGGVHFPRDVIAAAALALACALIGYILVP